MIFRFCQDRKAERLLETHLHRVASLESTPHENRRETDGIAVRMGTSGIAPIKAEKNGHITSHEAVCHEGVGRPSRVDVRHEVLLREYVLRGHPKSQDRVCVRLCAGPRDDGGREGGLP